jgi:acid stress-induced BolA-like protein IbaG/YrbA
VPDIRDPVIVVQGERPHLFATITSGSFAAIDEAERQEKVWAHLRALRPTDAVEVEFIFTNAPGEPTQVRSQQGRSCTASPVSSTTSPSHAPTRYVTMCWR